MLTRTPSSSYRRQRRTARHNNRAAMPVKIMHPHEYAEETQHAPSIVSEQSQALESMPEQIPHHVLMAGREAAMRRRPRRFSESTATQSSIEGSSYTYRSAYSPSYSPESTIVENTRTLRSDETHRPGCFLPLFRSRDRDNSRDIDSVTQNQKRSRTSPCRKLVILWKRISRVMRRIASMGTQQAMKRESWMPTGFVLVDPRASWWRRDTAGTQSTLGTRRR